MPQEPKKRHSRQRQGKRRASIRLSIPKTVACPNCKTTILPHAICPNCGYYRNREVLSPKAKNSNEKSPRPTA